MMKKIICIICSAALLSVGILGCFPCLDTSAEANKENQTISYADYVVLAENDYSNVATGLTPWYFGNTSGDFYPVVDPLDSTNTVMQYRHYWYGKGALFLGAKFESGEPGEISSLVKAQAIQVKENAVYEVEYDYYVTGTPNTTMEISLAVGDNIAVKHDDIPNITISCSEKMKELAAGIDASTGGWIRNQKAIITIPADVDFSNGKYLMIYATACQTATIYFDNIKVTTAEKYEAVVASDNDYSGAQTKAGDGTVVWPGLFVGSSGDMIPVNDPKDSSNQVMMYHHDWYGKGALFLGSDYTTYASETIKKESITVEAGVAYELEYDFYATGTVTHPLGLTLYLAIGDNPGDDSSETYSITTSYQLPIEQYASGHTFSMMDWERDNKIRFRLPNEWDLSNGSYIMILAENGKKDATLYFDNIEVKKINSSENIPFTDSVIAESGYDNAILEQYSEAFINTSGDTYPVLDPKDEKNRVMAYQQSWYGKGALFLGSDFSGTDAETIRRASIKVEAGATYEVEYDYYITGAVNNTNGLTISLAVGENNSADGAYKITTSYKKIVKEYADNTRFNMSAWKRNQKITITIPDNLDLTNGSYLMLLAENGGAYAVKVCFDNVKVTKKEAGVSLDYSISNECFSRYLRTDCISNDVFRNGNQSVMWYMDSDLTIPFSANLYNNGGRLTNLKLYGEYVDNDSAYVIGDLSGNEMLDDEDVSLMRNYLANEERQNSYKKQDINDDNVVDVRDIVRLKKGEKNMLVSNFRIANQEITAFTIVTPIGEYVLHAEANALISQFANDYGVTVVDETKAETKYEILIGNVRDITTELSDNSYYIKLEGNKLYVNGGSEVAIRAAITALRGYVEAGRNLSEGCVLEFEYINNGEQNTTLLNTVLDEEFETDFASGNMRYNKENGNTYFDKWGRSMYQMLSARNDEVPSDYYTMLSHNQVSAKGGILRLNAGIEENVTVGNTTYEKVYAGSEIRSDNSYFKYGYVEVKAKIQSSTGICPAFWLLGNECGEDTFYEVDIFECFGMQPEQIKATPLKHVPSNAGDTTKTTNHTNACEMLVDCEKDSYFNGYSNDGIYHTFAIEWTEKYLTWIFDGVRVMRMELTDDYACNTAMRPVLTCYSGVDVNSPATGLIDETTDWDSASLEVDYIKIFQF